MTQSPHIIIVDDEAPAREMVGDYLKMHGFGVTLCDGGKSLRSVIETQVPDLVVLDLNMPEEDGLSIIRDLKSRINVPVIMLTATASPIDRVVAYGVAWHEGQLLGLFNQLVGVATALMLITLVISGFVMWRRRKPDHALGAPPLPATGFVAAGLVAAAGPGLAAGGAAPGAAKAWVNSKTAAAAPPVISGA